MGLRARQGLMPVGAGIVVDIQSEPTIRGILQDSAEAPQLISMLFEPTEMSESRLLDVARHLLQRFVLARELGMLLAQPPIVVE